MKRRALSRSPSRTVPGCVVLGSEGMLGGMVSHYFSRQALPVRSCNRKDFEVGQDRIDDFFKKLHCQAGSYVLNCVGVVNRRMGQTAVATVVRVNSLFPHELAEVCQAQRLRLIHVSTDCVFDGIEGGYRESYKPSATDLYGMSKALGEPWMHAMVIRSSFIGPEVKNFYLLVSWVLAQEGKTLQGFANHFWNGVTSLQFAKMIQVILEKDLFEHGLFHVFSPQVVTKEKLIRMIAEAYKVKVRVNPVEVSPRVDRHLQTEKQLCEKLDIPPLKQQLAEMAQVRKARLGRKEL